MQCKLAVCVTVVLHAQLWIFAYLHICMVPRSGPGKVYTTSNIHANLKMYESVHSSNASPQLLAFSHPSRLGTKGLGGMLSQQEY